MASPLGSWKYLGYSPCSRGLSSGFFRRHSRGLKNDLASEIEGWRIEASVRRELKVARMRRHDLSFIVVVGFVEGYQIRTGA